MAVGKGPNLNWDINLKVTLIGLLFLVVVTLLMCIIKDFTDTIKMLADFLPYDLLPYILGFLFSTVVAHFPIKLVNDQMWLCVAGEKEDSETRCSKLTPIIGIIERVLYIGAVLVSRYELIGFWLALKVAGRIWPQEDIDKTNKRIPINFCSKAFIKPSSLFLIFTILLVSYFAS
jgi:hypothetical protein